MQLDRMSDARLRLLLLGLVPGLVVAVCALRHAVGQDSTPRSDAGRRANSADVFPANAPPNPREVRAQSPHEDQTPSASPPPDASDPVTISATYSQEWRQEHEAVWLLRECRIVQGDHTWQAKEAVVWRRTEPLARGSRDRITVFLRSDVRWDQPGSTRHERSLLMDVTTLVGVTIQARRQTIDQPGLDDPLFVQATAARKVARGTSIQPVQYRVPSGPDPGPELRGVQVLKPATGQRRIRISPRSAVPLTYETKRNDQVTPPEQVLIITGGVNVIVDGLPNMNTVDLTADRVVIWTQLRDGAGDADLNVDFQQSNDLPLQVYMEDNIIIRQMDKGKDYTIRGKRAFYDVREQRGLLHDAELTVPLPELQGIPFRLRADRIRQLAPRNFHAQRAWATTSEYGTPGYRLQATDIFLEQRPDDTWFFPNTPQIDAETGQLVYPERSWTTSLNNTFFVGNVPLFYLPSVSAPAEEPNIPLRTLSIQNDQIFGTQIRTVWNMFSLLGIDSPAGASWNLDLDYLGLRGPGIGSSGTYSGVDRFGLAGTYSGLAQGYYIHDGGRDNLGIDRSSLLPRDQNRGKILFRDQQLLPWDLTLQTETGYLSDRNFLEQYDENQYDREKDFESLLYLRQQRDNWTWSVLARNNLTPFFTTTRWLPRGDLTVLSEPLLGGWLTWSSRSYASYAQQRPADAPSDPADKFSLLPFEGNAEGAVLSTRHELNAPFNFGPLNVVPYALGEAAHWGQNYSGDSVSRLYGSAGVRGSIEFWRAFPNVWSDIFNLHGLAHKMVLDADYSFSESNQDLGAIPQFNEFDDNAQEQFRRRFLFNTFGGTLPGVFDPRFYAVRAGVAHSVTAPYNELVTDQQVLRLGWRHRLQTKVGPPENQRIKNWMTLDLESSFFPNSTRDNFGQAFGLYGARYNWFVGDRTTLTASSYFDTFDNAQQLWSVGVMSQRTTRGSIYAGLRQVSGAGLQSQILTASYNYSMSPKWISSFSTAYDLGQKHDLGQSVSLTRVGADFLIHLLAMRDPNKDNVSFGVSVEPRFGPFRNINGLSQLGTLLQGQPN
ncbi:MAG: hypothetical protein HZA46_19840 [Planctomycetales bacterium]|nr:hypothetical protein [Planctomycetales bacterium]